MKISKVLIKKYLQIKRDLPWRNTQDPYTIWLSEVILQQTRVAQGLPYFLKFSQKYPDLPSLAQANEDEILHLWQGLGYYSRARNMLKTAKLAFQQYGNQFPNSYQDLIQLKGIGPYTAAAVASFSNNEAKAVVDGNVIRVIARFMGVLDPVDKSNTRKQIDQWAQDWMEPKFAGLHNQAIMELGALICKPQNPLCQECPLASACYAFEHKMQKNIPSKSPKKSKKTRFLNYFIARSEKQLIAKRSTDDIWAGLYEFPLMETELEINSEQIPFPNPILVFNKKHVLSHQVLWVRIFEVDSLQPTQNNSLSVFNEELVHYGFPVVLQNAIAELFEE